MATGLAATLDTDGLWQAYTNCRDRETRDQLILQYAPLVKYVIGRMAVPTTGIVETDDLVSYGTFGLIEAVDRYDPSRGVTFQTYAMQRIRGAIIDALRKLGRVPRSLRQKARAIEQAEDSLRAEFCTEPAAEEICARAGISMQQYRQTLADASWRTVSLDRLLGADDGEGSPSIEAYAPGEEIDVSFAIERRERIQALVDAVKDLPEREKKVLALYYQEGLTMREIAQVIEVSESRVCQLRHRAIAQLKVSLRRVGLVA